jgi:hypothetical protein
MSLTILYNLGILYNTGKYWKILDDTSTIQLHVDWYFGRYSGSYLGRCDSLEISCLFTPSN